MAEEFLDFLIALTIIIAAAKLGGYISIRLRQPSVLGELLVGLILGPTVLDMIHTWPVFHEIDVLSETLFLLAELGVIVLMFVAGLELHLDELLRSGKVAALAGVLGVVVPLGLGYGTSLLFGTVPVEALFVALTLSATSVSISAQTLMEMGVLRSRVGLGLLGAAVFDDILVILLLSVSVVLVGGTAGGLGGVFMTIVGMVVYLILAILAGRFLVPPLVRWSAALPVSRGVIAFTLVITLFYAWTAEVVGGMAPITGAFLVGLFLAQTPMKERIEEGLGTIAYGFLVPVFFVNIGLQVNMRSIGGEFIWFALAITVIAVLSKIVGSGLGGLLGGFSPKESLQLGVGMVSRGEVGLIVASFALSEGLLSEATFSTAVFMVIVATLVTPLMLRALFARQPETQTAL